MKFFQLWISIIDVKTASAELLQQSEKKKKEQIVHLFKSFTEEEIEKILTENNWQVVDSTRKLEEIRKRRTEQKAEQERKKLEEQKHVQKLEKQKEPQKFEEVKRKKEEVTPLDPCFMERSVRLGEELEEVIKKANQESDPEEVFKKDLESKLRFGPNDLPGLPGIIPLSRKSY